MYDANVIATVYETADTAMEFNHSIEVERVTFNTEQEALDWADDMGYMWGNYSVSIEDVHGTVRWL